MRALLAVAVGLTMAAAGLVIADSSPNASHCTKIGTANRDLLGGTPRRDTICALQEGDYLSGSGSADKLFGDSGRDTIVGGPGADILKGGKGRDRLFGVDGLPDDLLNGEKGQDLCFGDPGDVMRGCEHRFRGATVQMANRMASAFNGGLTLAEVLQAVTPAPIIITATVTVPANCGGHPAPPPIC